MPPDETMLHGAWKAKEERPLHFIPSRARGRGGGGGTSGLDPRGGGQGPAKPLPTSSAGDLTSPPTSRWGQILKPQEGDMLPNHPFFWILRSLGVSGDGPHGLPQASLSLFPAR